LIQSNLDGREWTAMLGTKRGRSRRLPTPPAPREVASLHSDYNPTPKTKRVFEVVPWCDGYRQWSTEKAVEVVRGQATSAIKQEQMSCSHAEDPVVKELGEA